MLSSLTILRRRILPPALAEMTKWDTRLQLLGDAVQTQLETHCGRKFAYTEDHVETFPGEALTLKVSRYPITEVATLTRTDLDGTTADDQDNIEATYKLAGLVTLYTPGIPGDTLTLTYTGGYELDLTDDLSQSPTSGITQLPQDIREAWFLQVAQLHAAADQTGKPIPEGQPATPTTVLLPAVRELLAPYRRMA